MERNLGTGAKPASELREAPCDVATELRALSALRPHPRNYRRHPERQLAVLCDSLAYESDLLMSRGVAVKIAVWTAPLAVDDGSAYPYPDYLSANIAVFHNTPEPATLALLAVGGLMALRRRR